VTIDFSIKALRHGRAGAQAGDRMPPGCFGTVRKARHADVQNALSFALVVRRIC
jgi:hypothetical protein